MRSILLISYEFPPKGGTQAQHAAKLASALAERHNRVYVLSVWNPPSPLSDAALLGEVADRVAVERTFSLEPTRLVQLSRAFRRKNSGGHIDKEPSVGSRSYTSLPSWVIRFVQSFFLPDEKVGWTPWAVHAGNRLLKDRSVDAIVSTGPPFTAHLVAGILARRAALPWAADLRDPIVGGYFFRPSTPLHGRLMARFERFVVEGAAAVTLPTPDWRKELAARLPAYATRLAVLPNAYDPKDFKTGALRSPPHSRFVVSYVGAFQGSVRAAYLLDGVAEARVRNRLFARDVSVRLVGPTDAETEAAVEGSGLSGVVQRIGFVPHREAVAEMRSADVLVLVLGPEAACRGILTSKLPEYLAAGRPILGLVPEGSLADVLRRTGAAEIVAPNYATGVADALLRLYDLWRRDELPYPADAVTREFSWETVGGRWEEILRGLGV